MAIYSNVEVIGTLSSNGADLWTFIICCFVVITAILFVLFYFNRVLARVFTVVANQYLWKRYRTYIQLDSLQLTLIGARILFKNFQYHSQDFSFSVVKGHITLQYWLFNIQKANSLSKDDSKLPCRLVCSVEGFEGFIYNNIPLYERLKTILGLEMEPVPHKQPRDLFSMNGSTPSAHDPENQTFTESSLLQRLLPIQIECTTAAIILGNSQLPSYVIMKAAQASGTLNTGQPRTPLDYYKITLDLVLRKPQVSMEHNEHYIKEDENGNIGRNQQQQYISSWWNDLYQWTRWAFFFGPTIYKIKDNDYQEQHNYEPHCQHSFREDYAKIENIMDCSQIALCYYADIRGPVTSLSTNGYSGIGIDVGNGGLPPEWGVRFSLWNAIINYGPWTDKQRMPLQNYFFPNAHRTNKPTSRLAPGEIRIPTSFEFMMEFMTDTKLRVPTKEVSKNWKFTGDMPDLDTDKDGYYIRPYGWFDIKFKEGSSLKSSIPLVAGNDGSVATVDIELKDVDVTTSINFANLVRTDVLKLHVDVPFPLVWNEHRAWIVDAKANNSEAFLLRDHLHLLQDLVKDWIALPPMDLLHFVPTTYQLRLDAAKTKIVLCLNEYNIISYPNSIDDNTFAHIYLNRILFALSVPNLTYQPEVMSVNYDIQLDDVYGGVTVPSSHTWSSFLWEEDAELGSCKTILVKGAYEAYTAVDVLRHIESSNIHIKFQGAVLKLFGDVIRYVIRFRDNYFGSTQHFCTIDEYRQRRANPDEYMKMRKKEMDGRNLSDPFELYLLADVTDLALILPENLYESSHYSQWELRELQLELRILEIYMDMYMTLSPITWTRESHPNPTTRHRPSKMKNARDPGNYLYIDGVNIHVHRLFGPLPTLSTYLCQWEFDVGNVKGEIKPSFLMGLSNFAQTFVYNFIDEDNTLSLDLAVQPTFPDVTFASFQVRKVDIYLMTQNSSTQLQLHNGLYLDFDNLTNEKYNQRIGLQLLGIDVTCLANQDQSDQQQNNEHTWVEVARIKSGLNVTLFRQTKEWKQYRTDQQNFIRLQDQVTGRCTHLYESHGNSDSTPNANDHHVGVFYAPLFRPHPTQNLSGINHGKPTISTKQHTSNDKRSSISDDDDDECSMVSFNDQWLILPDSMNSETDHLRPYIGTRSTESIASNKDSFCTAESEDDIYTSVNLSNLEEASIDTSSEIDGEDDYDYNDMGTSGNSGQPGYTTTSIPPSIPYSDYLNRFAVKRATHLVGKGQAFFHPYIPPPKPSFIPQKAKFDQHDWKFTNDGGDFFAGFMDETDHHLPSDMKHNDGDDKQNDMVTTLVFEATPPVDILVTPILIKVVQEITEIINNDDWDLETMLDSSQMEYVGQLTRYLTEKFIYIRFAIWLPSIHLHFIQNVMIPADLPSYKHTQYHLQTLYDNENDMLCTADIFLDDFQLIGGFAFQDYAFGQKQTFVAESRLVLEESRVQLYIGNLGCKVQYVSDHDENGRHVMFGIPSSRQYVRGRNLRDSGGESSSSGTSEYSGSGEQQSTNELVVLDLGLNKLCCKWLGAGKPNYLDFDVNELSTIIITESVEIILGAAYIWLVFVSDLQRIIERFQDRRSRQNQVFIHQLSKFSNDDTKISRDPQFLTIPTSMGPRIGSKNFRNDVGWKLLARMRQCLRLMPLTDREKLQYRLTSGGAIEHVDPIALHQQVIQAFSGWRSWEIHTRDIRSCRLFTKIFLQHRESQHKNEHGLSTNTDDNDNDIDTTIDSNDLQENSPNGLVDNIVAYLMTSINHANIKINRFDFCIHEEEPDIDDNHIIIGPLEFAIDTVYKSSELGNSGNGLLTPTSEGYLDAVAKLDIGLIDVSVNPTILAFARHMLTVQWVFTHKLKTFSQPSSTNFELENSTSYMDQPSTATATAIHDQLPPFDINLLLSRIDVVAHVLVKIQQIQLSAWAQKLAMKNSIHLLCGSVVFSNPKLSPILRSEKDSDTNNSGRPSSNKTSRKQSSQFSRIIMNTSGGIDNLETGFYELVSYGHQRTSTSINNNYKHETARQDSKRIHTKLLSLTISDAKLNANIYQPSKTNKKQKSTIKNSNNQQIVKIFSSVGAVDMDAPQSLLRLYSFIEEWRTEQGQRYHFMFQNLLNEWEEQKRLTDQAALSNQTCVDSQRNGTGQQAAVSPAHWYDIKLQFLLSKFVMKADLLRSLGIKFSIDELLILVDATQQQAQAAPALNINYAFQLSKQVVEFITHTNNNIHVIDHPQSSNSTNTNAFNLPGIHSSGTFAQVMDLSLEKYGYQLQSSISVDFIAISLDVSMIDSLLTAQSLLGNEVNELIETLAYSRSTHHQCTTSPTTMTPSPSVLFKYTIGFSLDGLRIKAASPTANGLFESNVLEALISNHFPSTPNQQLLWNVNGSNFSLSLSHEDPPSVIDQQKEGVLDDGKRPDSLAYIVVDFGLQNHPICGDTNINTEDQNLDSHNITISKVQAVMQPMALRKLAEMYIYYDAELKRKKEIKREEMEQLAANTKRIVESLQSDTTINEHDIHKILQGKKLSLVVKNVGVAIPLSDFTEPSSSSSIPLPALAEEKLKGQQQQHHPHQHAALLFTFPFLEITTKKCATTTATIENITLQFVKRFDQSNVSHFLAANHPRMNQIRLPTIKCIVDSEFKSEARKLNVHIDAKARGFEVDLDGTIVDHLNRLAVIYDQGMDRVSAFTRETNSDAPMDNTPTPMEYGQHPSSASDLLHLDVTGLFEYGASVVRLYPRRQARNFGQKQGKTTCRRSTRGQHDSGAAGDGEREINEGFGVATIKLPGLDAELKYQTPLGALGDWSDFPQQFHTDILIRESNNILHPSLVQFLCDAASGLKFGMQQSTERKAVVPVTSWKKNPINISASIVLRLSKTKLDLSCQPTSKVICSLGWDTSEFIVNSSSDGSARTTSCFGSLRSISTVVKHHFSPQSCLTANVDLVEFNATLAPNRGGTQVCNDISVVVKIPSIQCDISMRHLQDLLILFSCWFAQSFSQIQSRQVHQQASGKQHSGTPFFAGYLTLVLDKVVFSVDMGQAIGKIMVVPRNLSLQTHMIPAGSLGIDLSLDGASVTSEGRLTGEATVYRIVLHGRSNTSTLEQLLCSLLHLEFDGLRAKFTYEYQNILELLQEPIQVTATIDYNNYLEQANSDIYHQLKLAIHLGRFIATVSVKTVPVIIVMHQRFMELLEKKQNEASAVCSVWVGSTNDVDDNPSSSQSLLTSSSAHLSNESSAVIINQRQPQCQRQLVSILEIFAESFQLIVYPSQFQDGDNVELHAMQMEASLQQTPKATNEGTHRHLLLSIDKATLLKNVPGQKIMKKRHQQLDHIITSKRNQSMDNNDNSSKMDETNLQNGGKGRLSKEVGSIFTLPMTKVVMDSTQVMQTVEYTFAVDFKDRVQVSLNIGQLKYLQDLVNSFMDQMTRAMNTVDSISISRKLDSVEQHEEEGMHGNDTTSLDSGIGVGDLTIGQKQQQEQQQSPPPPPPPPPKCTTAVQDNNDTLANSNDQLTYTTDDVIRFNPQIRQMGDATPPLQWIPGLKLHLIPKLVHEKLTLQVDQMVQTTWDFYYTHTQGN